VRLGANGVEQHLSMSGAPVFDASGAFKGYYGVGTDITERKRAEQRLRELSQAVEQSPAGTLITDIHGRIKYANPIVSDITGYALEELIGKTPAVIKSELTPLHVYQDLWRTITSGKVWRGEMQNRKKNGELYWEQEIISSVQNERGEIVNFIAVKEDITERKRRETALQQDHVERLEFAERMAAGVAHEVKNPLTIVRLGIDYLSKQFCRESNRKVFDDVSGAIDRADNVVADLLDFSRQKQFDRRPIDINQVIEDAIRFTKHETERRNIEIAGNRDDPMPPIYADPDRLVQVFINLLSNAAQAIGKNGRIEVATRTLRLTEHDLEQAETGVFRIGEPVITVDIRDNGPGVPPEHAKNLFQPFFTTKPKGEGTGLGLAITRYIVFMHRGSIKISNRPEGGVSALLTFRVAREGLTDEKTNTVSR
jgi:PAS domain S-box-containing protein